MAEARVMAAAETAASAEKVVGQAATGKAAARQTLLYLLSPPSANSPELDWSSRFCSKLTSGQVSWMECLPDCIFDTLI